MIIKPNFLSQTRALAADNSLLKLSFDSITSAGTVPECIKMLALNLQISNYISTGNFFKSLSDNSVEELFKLVELIETKDFKQFFITSDKGQEALTNITLLGMLLCLAEGEAEMTKDELKEMVSALCSIILTETLSRTKGTVKLLRNNYSLVLTDRIIGIPVKQTKG